MGPISCEGYKRQDFCAKCSFLNLTLVSSSGIAYVRRNSAFFWPRCCKPTRHAQSFFNHATKSQERGSTLSNFDSAFFPEKQTILLSRPFSNSKKDAKLSFLQRKGLCLTRRISSCNFAKLDSVFDLVRKPSEYQGLFGYNVVCFKLIFKPQSYPILDTVQSFSSKVKPIFQCLRSRDLNLENIF